MKVTFDPAKREKCLVERGLDFADAADVFAGKTFRWQDDRRDYGETRMVAAGYLRERVVIVVWTERGDSRHIISMRKANEREQKRYEARLD
jgi:uncharacterized DUF497 family protein